LVFHRNLVKVAFGQIYSKLEIMWVLALEAAVALSLLILIVWWTRPRKKNDEEEKDDEKKE
jgi:heme A synthase